MPIGIIGAIAGVIILVALIIAVVVIIIVNSENRDNYPPEKNDKKEYGFWEWLFTPEYKRAGIRGEQVVVRAVESVLREDDRLLTNVSIEYDGKPAELDSVIVNKYGVFIIEAKNYAGNIIGNEDDYEWTKYKTTSAGNTYAKAVRNPIRQVKREIYVLAHYLDYYGVRVWVKGYAILVNGNSPVESEYILKSIADIDCAIHTRDRRMLDKKTVESIIELLS